MTDTAMERQEAAVEQEDRRARYGGTDLFRGVLVLVIAAAVGILLVGQTPSSPRFLADGSADDAVAGPDADLDDAAGSVGETANDATGGTALGAAPDGSASDGSMSDSTMSDSAMSDGAASDSAASGSAMPDADDGSQAASSDIFPDADADVANGDAAGSEGNAMADGRRPGDVIVVVLNHTGQKGIAGAETDKLEAAGYSTLPAANAASSSGSGIYYETGYEVEAETLAKTLGLSTTGLVRPMSDSGAPVASERDVSAANLVVVLGRDGFLPAT